MIQCIIYENDLKMNDIATCFSIYVYTIYLLFIPVFAFKDIYLHRSKRGRLCGGKRMIRYCDMAQIARKS